MRLFCPAANLCSPEEVAFLTRLDLVFAQDDASYAFLGFQLRYFLVVGFKEGFQFAGIFIANLWVKVNLPSGALTCWFSASSEPKPIG
jgi:uncharacterized membrane protein YagU involved in acid resistance